MTQKKTKKEPTEDKFDPGKIYDKVTKKKMNELETALTQAADIIEDISYENRQLKAELAEKGKVKVNQSKYDELIEDSKQIQELAAFFGIDPSNVARYIIAIWVSIFGIKDGPNKKTIH